VSLPKVRIAGGSLVRRACALAGVAGPATFIATWAVLGARASGYSPAQDPISRLAAVNAPTHAAMTAGFLAFGAGVGVYARELRNAFPGGAGLAALVTAGATIAIAATPLDSALGGTPHAVAAGVAYASLAAIPVLARPSLARRGHLRAAAASVAVGISVAACLAGSVIARHHAGAWQRLGLTLGDAWLIVSALLLARTPQHPTNAGSVESPTRHDRERR
jgi:hypothetical protein